MASSQTAICNAALQKLGAKRIADIDDASNPANACRDAYERIRDAELRKYVWTFATGRALLAANASAPDWGRMFSYQLPSDYIRMADEYEECNKVDKDWEIEGKAIYTNDPAPLHIRYVKRITDTSLHDPLFDDALACSLALELCELLTQSNTKKAAAATAYDRAIAEAKRVGSIERRARVAPQSEWFLRRF